MCENAGPTKITVDVEVTHVFFLKYFWIWNLSCQKNEQMFIVISISHADTVSPAMCYPHKPESLKIFYCILPSVCIFCNHF